MTKCEHCGKEVLYPFKCSFCGRYFCSEHRLPENHDCPNQPSRTPLGRWKAKKYPLAKLPKMPKSKAKKTARKVKERIKEEGEFYFIKEGSPSTQEKKTKSRKLIKKIAAVLLAVMIISVILWNTPIILSVFQKIMGLLPSSTSESNQTSTYSHGELTSYALLLINSDRSQHGLSNVSLSSIGSGQQHADNMLKYHFFSHCDTNGYKPYMRYTLAGGQGSVSENVAWQYSSGPFDVKEAIRDLEWQMMYDDSDCDWGHRDNILNPFHNKVSIGIAFDNNDLYFVQDFENDYIEWSTLSVSINGEVAMKGTFPNEELSAKWINIFYDNLPSSLTSEQLGKPEYTGGYTMGTFVGMVVPSGYESPEGITITTQKWTQTGRNFEIRFDLSKAFSLKGKGVYTLYLQPDSETIEDSLTSYSIWHDK